jgi:site-specific DNA-methyltransferase (adenine-specific)
MASELKGIDGITRQIEVLKQAATDIRSCSEVGQVKRVADMAQMVKLAAQRVGASVEVQNEATAAAIRARHWQGCLLRDMSKHRGGRPGSNGRTADTMSGVPPSLKDLGINHQESSRAQAIAAVPLEEVERTIALALRDRRELTTQEVVIQGRRRQRHRHRRERREAGAAARATARAVPDWGVRQADCIEGLGELEGGTVRLIFADPNYNQGVPYGDHCDDRRSPAEYLERSRAWIEAAARALTPDGSLWILISYEWAAELKIAAEGAGLHLRQWLTWYESFGVNCTGMFNRCSRPLLWLVKDPDRFVFNAEATEIRRPSDRQAKYDDARADPDGKLWDDVWGIKPEIYRVAGTHRERIEEFPTQLPLALLRPIVACASDPGDLVVDPFSGSGTTGAACIELGRRYIGFELSPEFAELSRQRLIAHEAEPGPGTSDHTGGPVETSL